MSKLLYACSGDYMNDVRMGLSDVCDWGEVWIGGEE